MDPQVRACIHAERSVEILKRQMLVTTLEEMGENPRKIQEVQAWRVLNKTIYGPYAIFVSRSAVYLVPSLDITEVAKWRW